MGGLSVKIALAIALLFPIAIFQLYIVIDAVKIAGDNNSSNRKRGQQQGYYVQNENLRKNNIRVISR